MKTSSLFQNLQPFEQEIINALPELRWFEACERGSAEKQGHIHSTAVIADQVCIGDGCEIGPFVVIEENVVIGKKVIIRSGALIRSHTIIGDNCVIGHGAEIKHAFIREGAKIQGNTFVGDSIVGRGARIGTGVVIGNRRFDQKEISWQTEDGPVETTADKLGVLIGDYARLGANVTTNPGTVIGAYTWVAGGQSVSGFIPPKMFVKADGEVVENRKAGKLNNVDREGKS